MTYEKHKKHLNDRLKEQASEAQLIAILEKYQIPEPRYLYTHELGIGYEVQNISDAITLMQQLWPHHIDGKLFKSKGFQPYFRYYPYHADKDEEQDQVSFILDSTYYTHSGIDTKIEFYLYFTSELIVNVNIKILTSPVRITSKHEYRRCGHEQIITRYNWQYWGLDTGNILWYSSASEWPHFKETFSGVDTEDIPVLLSAPAANIASN